jgi:hypothetical protein
MAKVTPEQQAIQALSQALADPAPKILFGSAKKAGIFSGSSQPIKNAAQLCLQQGWLEPTGEFEGAGKSRKEKYRVTSAGAQAAIERSEPVQLLRQALAATEALAKSRDELFRQQQAILDGLRRQEEATQQAMKQQARLLDAALQRFRTPAPTSAAPTQDGAPARWRDEALNYLQAYQSQHIQAFASLADLFETVVRKHGVSIGQFHDGIRDLAHRGEIRLHPFTGARYSLEREEYAVLAGKEIMYYAERIAHS